MRLKHFLPKGLYGRVGLILLLPILTIQLIVSIAFIQRYFEGVTRQLSASVVAEVRLIQRDMRFGYDAKNRAADFAMTLRFVTDAPQHDQWGWRDLTGAAVAKALRAAFPRTQAVVLPAARAPVALYLMREDAPGIVQITIPRSRLSPPNPHQLLVIMAVSSLLLIAISYLFLRNQLRPIAALARAATAFGRGENLSYRPRGALEIRAAGRAFLDMRMRLDTTLRTRSLMLSGISHDLRTPLTRLHLGLTMLPEDDDTRAMLADVREMEQLIAEFLAFMRDDTLEMPRPCDPIGLSHDVVRKAGRSGRDVALDFTRDVEISVMLRPKAISRALSNLIENALRYGKKVRLSLVFTQDTIEFRVDDDGPGIDPIDYETALAPFGQLNAGRPREAGVGVGLGLAIVGEIARRHFGRLSLHKSDTLGGLSARLSIPCSDDAP